MNILPPSEEDQEYKKIVYIHPSSKPSDKIPAPKKRVTSQQWTFSLEDCSHPVQLQLIHQLSSTISFASVPSREKVIKTIAQEIRKKIQGYKQQDKHKKILDESQFITYDYILEKMIECQLLCRYCNHPIYILYDISRENTQWTVDRIDNHLGHNRTNVCLSCLECNLKKRRRSDEKFYFAQRMVLIKCPAVAEGDDLS